MVFREIWFEGGGLRKRVCDKGLGAKMDPRLVTKGGGEFLENRLNGGGGKMKEKASNEKNLKDLWLGDKGRRH